MKILSSLLFGLAAAFTLNYSLFMMGRPPLVRAALLAGAFCLFSGLAYWGLYRFALPRFRANGIGRRGQALIILGFLLAGVLLAMAYPVTPFLPGRQTLEIVATGEQNPASASNEVHLEGLFFPDGSKEDYARFVKYGKDKWDILDDQLIAKGNLPARTVWRSDWAYPIRLIFHTTDSSGQVRIIWNEKEVQSLDLYSEVASVKQVDLAPRYPAGYISRYWLVSGVVIGLLLILLAAWLVKPASRPAAEVTPRTSPWSIALFALPMIAVWLFYWLALWPGILTVDSTDQLWQIAMGAYSDAHPVVLTWTWWLILRLWNSPAAISLFHILALAFAAGLSYYQMRRLGTRLGWLVIGAALFALSIVNGLMVVALWKDVLFSTAFLLFFVFWLDILVTRGVSLGRPLYFLGFLLVAALSALYRHNGLPTILFSLVALLLFMPGARRRVSLALAILVALILLIKGPLFDRMNVDRADTFFESVFELYHLAAHIDAGTSFSESDRQFLNAIHPLEDGWNYTCLSVGPLLNSESTNLTVAYTQKSQLRQAFLHSLLANPWVNLSHLLCSSSIVWRIRNPSLVPTRFIDRTVAEQTTRNPAWFEWVYARYGQSLAPQQEWYNWRPAVYLYLFLFGVAVTAIKKGKRYLLLAVPVIGICLPIILANHSLSFRYLYPVYIISLLYWPYLLTNRVTPPEPATEGGSPGQSAASPVPQE